MIWRKRDNRVRVGLRFKFRGDDRRSAISRPCARRTTFKIELAYGPVDSLLKAKLQGSGLEPYVEVVAHIDTEKRLVPIYRLET